MKKLILLAAVMGTIGFSYSQSRNLNTKVNTGKALNKSVKLNPVIKNQGNLKSLKSAKHSKNLKLKGLPKLGISQADLDKNSRKSAKITPRKPVHQQLFLEFFGEYSKNHFLLTNRPVGAADDYYKYSAFARFNPVRGKEYRVKIALNPNYYKKSSKSGEMGTVLVNLGGQEYRAVATQETKEINFVFKAETTAIKIGISPLQMDSQQHKIMVPGSFGGLPPAPSPVSGYRSEPLPIKFIQIDEI